MPASAKYKVKYLIIHGLYNRRCGTITVLADSEEQAKKSARMKVSRSNRLYYNDVIIDGIQRVI